MTDRFDSLTVVLDQPIREDDAAALISAISQLRGVLSVKSNVADIYTHAAYERARIEVIQKLLGVVNKDFPKR